MIRRVLVYTVLSFCQITRNSIGKEKKRQDAALLMLLFLFCSVLFEAPGTVISPNRLCVWRERFFFVVVVCLFICSFLLLLFYKKKKKLL